MHGHVNIYDAYYGEILYSYYSSEEFLKRTSVLHGYECSFSKDEKYIIYMIENNQDENDTWSVAVIKWEDLSNIVAKARKVISGRSLSDVERRYFYIE